jgi:hypothetical protein
MRMEKGAFAGLCCAVLVLCMMVLSYGAQEETQATALVSFPEPAYTFDAVFEGASVPHDFVIQNKGTGALDVKQVTGG